MFAITSNWSVFHPWQKLQESFPSLNSILPESFQWEKFTGSKDIALSPITISDPMVQTVADVAKPEIYPYRGLSSAGMNGQYVVADISTIIRSVLVFFPEYADSIILPSMGITTGLAALTGFFTTKNANSRLQTAEKLNDEGGVLEAKVDLARGITQTASGVAFIGQRVFSTYAAAADLEVGAGSSSLVGRATYWFSMIGMALFSVFFAIFGVFGSIRLKEELDFRSEMQEHASSPEKLVAFLEDKLRVTEESVFDELGKDANKVLFDEAMDHSKKFVKTMVDELRLSGVEIPEVSEEEYESIVLDLFTAQEKGLSHEQVLDRAKERMMLNGLQMRMTKNSMKNQNIIGRVLGEESLEKITQAIDAKPLSQRMVSTNPEVRIKALTEGHELIEQAQKDIKINIAFFAGLIVTCILGLASLVVSMIFLSGPGVLVGAALFALCGLGMLVLDGYGMWKGMASNEKGHHERAVVWTSNLVLLAALTTATVLSGGTIPAMVALSIALPWLAINISVALKMKIDRSDEEDKKKQEQEKMRKDLQDRIFPHLAAHIDQIQKRAKTAAA